MQINPRTEITFRRLIMANAITGKQRLLSSFSSQNPKQEYGEGAETAREHDDACAALWKSVSEEELSDDSAALYSAEDCG